MAKQICIQAGAGETRVAVVTNGVLRYFSFERTIGEDGESRRSGSASATARVGDIVLARVEAVMPGIDAAFVDIGVERAGFLAARDASPHKHGDAPPIAQCVREGETLLVQVIKEAIADKGARLSTNIALAGRLLVLTPNVPRIALSRRIAEEAERERLGAIIAAFAGHDAYIQGGGYVVRTAAAAASEAEIAEDAKSLAETWRTILAAQKTAKPPATLYRELSLWERTLRDESGADAVLIDDARALAEAREFCRRTMPGAEAKLALHDRPEALFEMAGLEEEIAALFETRVALSSGGSITIESTEAATVIDVNSGRFVQSGDIEETAMRVNLEAAETIGRQIVLRGIAGLIVIDFIHAPSREDGARLVERLRNALAGDRAPSRILAPSEFGVVEMTRKRMSDSLENLSTEPSAGGGRRKTVATIACEILRRVERAGRAAPGKEVVVSVSAELAQWLEINKSELGAALRRRGAPRVSVRADQGGARENYSVETAA